MSSSRSGNFVHIEDERETPPPGARAVRVDPRRAAFRVALALLDPGTLQWMRQSLGGNLPPPPEITGEVGLVFGEVCREQYRRVEADVPTVVEIKEGKE